MSWAALSEDRRLWLGPEGRGLHSPPAIAGIRSTWAALSDGSRWAMKDVGCTLRRILLGLKGRTQTNVLKLNVLNLKITLRWLSLDKKDAGCTLRRFSLEPDGCGLHSPMALADTRRTWAALPDDSR